MESRNPELPPIPPPPGAVSALLSGFNAIANNVTVILFPVLLDLFLWLGPRLTLGKLIDPSVDILPAMQIPADQVKLVTQGIQNFYNGFNMFSALRTFPLGVFSLIAVNLDTRSPLGLRPVQAIPDWFVFFIFWLGITVVGWLAGSLYFRAVSRVALNLKDGPKLLSSVFHSVLISGIWMLCSCVAVLPLAFFLLILTPLDADLRLVILFVLAIPLSWLMLAVFFSFYGVFTRSQNAFASIWSSARMVRYGLPPLGWFVLLEILISQGMNMIWQIPPADSWMTLVGIFGHAFVSTGLLAASFIYYRDLNTWIESALQWLKSQKTSSARA